MALAAPPVVGRTRRPPRQARAQKQEVSGMKIPDFHIV